MIENNARKEWSEEHSIHFLHSLQHKALQYFLDNQGKDGLILDRQANHGPRRPEGLCSTAATGMGLIAIALASQEPHTLLSEKEAQERIAMTLHTALQHLPHDDGIMPHFLDAQTMAVCGNDCRSTVDSAWLLTGALWSAALLNDSILQDHAEELYRRVNWRAWSVGNPPLLCHGREKDGRIPHLWDRLNGETAFLYLLAIGAAEEHALPTDSWMALRTTSETSGENTDLGLFAHQYSAELIDVAEAHLPGHNLLTQATEATEANMRACQKLAARFTTYASFWGLSAGDGPGEGEKDCYRAYAPGRICDGTAHITATIASIATNSQAVLANIAAVQQHPSLLGHYGISNVNLDKGWRSRDIVGIDLGAVVLALENFFLDGRIRRIFHTIPCIQQACSRLATVGKYAADGVM